MNSKQISWTEAGALLIGVGVLLATAASRGAEYDEGYTLLLAAGTPRPAWPAWVFRVSEARAVFAGHAGLGEIALALRATDVHPPLYFWTVAAWRWIAGPGLFGVRLLSVLYAALALWVVGAIARCARVPPAGAILLTVGCYGFAYTGAIARDFALAQALSLAGVWLALRTIPLRHGQTCPRARGEMAAEGRVTCANYWSRCTTLTRSTDVLRPLPKGEVKGHGAPTPHPDAYAEALGQDGRRVDSNAGGRTAFAAGLCLGAATISNYLAGFVAGAVLLWLLSRLRVWVAAVAGFGLFLPAGLWFYLGQRDSRPGQFPPFSLLGSLPRLAHYAAANLFGGLPLYVPAAARDAVAAGLACVVVLLVGVVVLRWHRIGASRPRHLLTLAALAPPVGLLWLGLAFDSTPIELRYLAFATPFAGLLLAGALASLPSRWCFGVGGVAVAIQAAALCGMMTRQETMQPASATAAAAAGLAEGGVVLLPRGNDGVGVVGAFVNAAPGDLLVLIVDQTDTIYQLDTSVGAARRVVLALIGVDAASRATSELLRAAFTDAPCWRPAAVGFNVRAFDRVCGGEGNVLRRLHANDGRSSGR